MKVIPKTNGIARGTRFSCGSTEKFTSHVLRPKKRNSAAFLLAARRCLTGARARAGVAVAGRRPADDGQGELPRRGAVCRCGFLSVTARRAREPGPLPFGPALGACHQTIHGSILNLSHSRVECHRRRERAPSFDAWHQSMSRAERDAAKTLKRWMRREPESPG